MPAAGRGGSGSNARFTFYSELSSSGGGSDIGSQDTDIDSEGGDFDAAAARRRHTVDERRLNKSLEAQGVIGNGGSSESGMRNPSTQVTVLSPILEAAAVSGLLPFDTLSLHPGGNYNNNNSGNGGTPLFPNMNLGEGDNIGGLDSAAMSSMHLRLFRLSTSQFLRREIQASLLPATNMLREFVTLTQNSSNSSNSLVLAPSHGPPKCLELQVLVRKVRSLVRQAMRIAVVPGYEHTPMPAVLSKQTATTTTGETSAATAAAAAASRNESLCYDVSQYVRVMAVPGGDLLRDSKFVHGIVFPKNIAHRSMRGTITDPRIVLLASGLEWHHRAGGGVVSMETVRDQERKYVEIMVSKVAAVQPSLVVTTGVVSALATQMLLNLGITCLRNVDQDILRRLSHFTGATILANAHVISHFDPDQVVGTCGSFRVQMHLRQPYTYFEASAPGEEKLMEQRHAGAAAHVEVFAGVGRDFTDPNDGGGFSGRVYGRRQNMIGSVGTVLVRMGDPEDLVSFHLSALVRRLVRASIAMSYSLGLEAAYLRDMHGMLSDMVPISTIAEHNSKTSDSLHLSRMSAIAQAAAATAAVSATPLRRAQTVPVKKGEGDASNMAPAWVARPRIVEQASNPYLSVPNVAKAAGQALRLNANAEDRFDAALVAAKDASRMAARRVSLTSTNGTREEGQQQGTAVPGSLSHGVGHDEPTETTTALDSEHFDAFGRSQNLLFASCWRHPDDDRQCARPVVKGIRFYSPNDPPLGLWMRQQCFNRTLGCQSHIKKCKRSAMKHRLTYTRPEGQLSITTEVMQPEYMRLLSTLLTDVRGVPLSTMDNTTHSRDWDPSSNVIYTWAFCKICDTIVTPVRPLTAATLALSFGRFLEAWFYNGEVCCRDPACGHRVHRDHIRFFGRGDLAACFEYDEIRVFSVSLPGVKSENDHTTSAVCARRQQRQLLESQRRLEIASNGAATPAADASRLRPQMAPAEGWDRTTMHGLASAAKSSTAAAIATSATDRPEMLVDGGDGVHSVKAEIGFICEATEIIFQAFQERMRGFLLERMIRSCLHQGGGRGTPNALMRRGQEIYGMLRAEWLDCWQSMYEEQAAFAKLVGVGGSAKASEELLWTSGNVTSLELYSLRRRLVQMVDRWNEMMVALYTMVVREGFGGKWVPFDTLDRLIEAGFGQTLDVNGSVGPKRRLSRGGSFVGKTKDEENSELPVAVVALPIAAVLAMVDADGNRRDCVDGGGTTTPVHIRLSEKRLHAEASFSGYVDEVNALVAKKIVEETERETNNADGLPDLIGVRDEAESFPTKAGQEAVRAHTQKQQGNRSGGNKIQTHKKVRSITSSDSMPAKAASSIPKDKMSEMRRDTTRRPSPVVRADTEMNSGRFRSPSWSDVHVMSPDVQRANTVDASAYTGGKDPRAERKRLLNSGPLAHYAYAGLLDGILNVGMGAHELESDVDGLFNLMGISSEPIRDAVVTAVAGGNSSSSSGGVGDGDSSSTKAEQSTALPYSKQSTASQGLLAPEVSGGVAGKTRGMDTRVGGMSGLQSGVSYSVRRATSVRAQSTRNGALGRQSSRDANSVHKSGRGIYNSSGTSSSTMYDAVPNGGGLLSWADPRAVALAVPLDAFPKLSRRHLRLPEGLHGIVIPVNWPDNPASVVAKALSTSHYRDGLRDAIETTRNVKHDALASARGERARTNPKEGGRVDNKARYSPAHFAKRSSSPAARVPPIPSPAPSSSSSTTTSEVDASEPAAATSRRIPSRNAAMTTLGLSELLVTTVKSDLSISFADDQCDFQCTVPWAANFYALRCAYCSSRARHSPQRSVGVNANSMSSATAGQLFTEVDSASYLSSVTHRVFEESYVQALCQASVWKADGGKSGATFCRSSDGRFVIKRIRKTEYDMFITSAKHYFEYLREALYEDMPTMLVKILGIHAIKVSTGRGYFDYSFLPPVSHVSHRYSWGLELTIHSHYIHTHALAPQSQVFTKRGSAPTHHTSTSMTGQIDRMALRSMSNADNVDEHNRTENSGAADGSKEGGGLDETLGMRTVYVIVQENLFHGSSGQLSSVFDLKGVLRYGTEPTGVFNSSGSGLMEDMSVSGSAASSVHSGSPASGISSVTHRHQKSTSFQGADGVAGVTPGSSEDSAAAVSSMMMGDRTAQLGPANPQVLLDGDFLRCTAGLPVPLFERDKALMNVAIFNDTMFLQMLNVIDYSLLVGVQESQTVVSGGGAGSDGGRTVVVNTMTAGIIDYLHPYNVAKRMEGYFKNAQHELKLRAAESTIQKASEYKRRFRASADLYFMALPSSDSD